MGAIFILDDCTEVQGVLKVALGKHDLTFAHTLQEARSILHNQAKAFDLFVLDLMLPDGSGLDLCAELQAMPEVENKPILFLTSKNQTSDKVAGLSLGVDDYITKPFDPIEIRARVELRLRKYLEKNSASQVFTKGDLEFDLSQQKVSLLSASGRQPIALTAFEFKLLLFLAKHEDHLLSREQLMQSLWGDNVHVLDRSIDSHMSNLRKKLRASSRTIKSVYGEGYRFTAA